MKRCQRRQRIS